MDFLATFFDNYGMLLAQGTWDTLLMTIVSTFFAYVIGIPLGVLCVLTSPKGLMPHRIFNMVLGWIINIGRSIPFIILLVALIPFTRFIVGTSLGVPGAIVPLVISAAPFIARMVEQSIEEVDGGLVEAAQAVRTPGRSSTGHFLREALPSARSWFRDPYSSHPGLLCDGRLRRCYSGFGRYRDPLQVTSALRRCHDRYGYHPYRDRADRAECLQLRCA